MHMTECDQSATSCPGSESVWPAVWRFRMNVLSLEHFQRQPTSSLNRVETYFPCASAKWWLLDAARDSKPPSSFLDKSLIGFYRCKVCWGKILCWFFFLVCLFSRTKQVDSVTSCSLHCPSSDEDLIFKVHACFQAGDATAATWFFPAFFYISIDKLYNCLWLAWRPPMTCLLITLKEK